MRRSAAPPLAALLLLAGCFDPDLSEPIACTENGACPGDLECGGDGICRTAPAVPDASPDGDGRLPQPDASDTQHGSWEELLSTPVPPPRFGHALAANFGGGLVLFAGSIELAAETWVFGQGQWEAQDLGDTESPGRRIFHAMAYDPRQKVSVLFGGSAGAGDFLADTWAWTGGEWVEKTPLEGNPPARHRHAIAHDGQGIVLFGGFDGTVLGDTWRFADAAWIDLTPSLTDSPSARQGHAVAYDPARERVVLFGGEDESGEMLGDTWEWTGSEWTRPDRSGDAPAPRAQHAMAYDPQRERVVLFGGRAGDDERLADTWAWDGETWRRLDLEFSPRKRQGHAIARPRGLQSIVLFGGRDGADVLSDTWVLKP